MARKKVFSKILVVTLPFTISYHNRSFRSDSPSKL